MMTAPRSAAPSHGVPLVQGPEAECGPWDLKARALGAGICGTDLHIMAWDSSAESMCDAVPFTPGHEFYGEVVAVGAEVCDVQMGDRVSGEGHIVCGTCRNCRAGRRHMRSDERRAGRGCGARGG